MGRYIYTTESISDRRLIVCYDSVCKLHRYLNSPYGEETWRNLGLLGDYSMDSILSQTMFNVELLGTFDSLDNPVEVLYGV